MTAQSLVKQGARFATFSESQAQFEKSNRDHKPQFLKSEKSILMLTLNKITLNHFHQIHELVVNAQKIIVICIQEH